MLRLFRSLVAPYDLKWYENELSGIWSRQIWKYSKKETTSEETGHLFYGPNEKIYGLMTGSSFTSGLQDKKPAELKTQPCSSLPVSLILIH
jgi:hypothetical protein